MALACMAATVAIVYADRGGYHDNADGTVSFLDSVYYATVTLSTTGYGDIVPYSASARLSNVLLVTPLRVLFLIILVGTTLEVLTERTREQYRQQRWRSAVRDHTVIVGYARPPGPWSPTASAPGRSWSSTPTRWRSRPPSPTASPGWPGTRRAMTCCCRPRRSGRRTW
jgi:voltage-gated potassium channel